MLLTVLGDHLYGFAAVTARLEELRLRLPPETTCLVARPPLSALGPYSGRTCLPCQTGYIATAAWAAKQRRLSLIATGYSGYQSDWPEQTAAARQVLREVMQQAGLSIAFPVADLLTKSDAEKELSALGLRTAALEQKCLQQQFNTMLSAAELSHELNRWRLGLAEALADIDEHAPEILVDTILGGPDLLGLLRRVAE